MSLHIWKAIRDCSDYALKVGDEFEAKFPEHEGDLMATRIQSYSEFQITREMIERLGKPFRLGWMPGNREISFYILELFYPLPA
jgi:hypothetical protein